MKGANNANLRDRRRLHLDRCYRGDLATRELKMTRKRLIRAIEHEFDETKKHTGKKYANERQAYRDGLSFALELLSGQRTADGHYMKPEREK